MRYLSNTRSITSTWESIAKHKKFAFTSFLLNKKNLSHPRMIALLIRMTTPFPLFYESLLPRGRHWIQYETLTRSLECMLMAHGCVQDMVKANIKRIIPGNIFCKHFSCDKSLDIQLAMRKKGAWLHHGSLSFKVAKRCLIPAVKINMFFPLNCVWGLNHLILPLVYFEKHRCFFEDYERWSPSFKTKVRNDADQS